MTETEEETKRLAKNLAPLLQAGDTISLSGDLGAGKTRFVQGLAEGLEIPESVTSPTFTIVREYSGRLPLFHFDVYRLSGSADLAALGYEEYFYGNGVTVVEWGDKIDDLLPTDHLTIELLRVVDSENRRLLIITAGGPGSERLKKGLARA